MNALHPSHPPLDKQMNWISYNFYFEKGKSVFHYMGELVCMILLIQFFSFHALPFLHLYLMCTVDGHVSITMVYLNANLPITFYLWLHTIWFGHNLFGENIIHGVFLVLVKVICLFGRVMFILETNIV
jgi:hypothetical protein